MTVAAIKTRKVSADQIDIFNFLDEAISKLDEKSILTVTSKVIALCENRIIPISTTNIDMLIKIESDYYLPNSTGKYGYHFTITNDTLVSAAGIDESNGNNNYVLWPKNPQRSANQIRRYLVNRFGLKNIGVIITDSTCLPLRRGTIGLALAYSGFKPLKNYIGKPDLFGRPFKVSQASIAGGLAAAATLAMGEGNEQTPLCIITDVPFVRFQTRNPSADELANVNMPLEDDLYAPFLKSVRWRKGKRSSVEE